MSENMAAAVRKVLRSRLFHKKARKHTSHADLDSLVTQDETLGIGSTATRYENLPDDHFRLLQILGKVDGQLHCSLKAFPMNDAPKYRALSYSWGPPVDSKLRGGSQASLPHNGSLKIIVNGQTVEIRQNLFDYLEDADSRDRRIHFHVDTFHIDPADDNETSNGAEHNTFQFYIERPMNWDSDIYYWIDALCINQCDEDEKAAQVNRMGSIYESAEVVIIWLGKANKYTPRVIEMINHLGKVYDEDCRTGYKLRPPTALETILDPEQKRRLGLQHFNLQDWAHFIVFFERTWFSRAWTLQEVVLARAVACYCGSYDIDWNAIYAASLMMDLTILKPMLNYLYLELEIKRTVSVSRVTLAMHMRALTRGKAEKSELSKLFKTWYNASSGNSSTPGLLDYCLARIYGTQCVDPRDQIFACFGIVRKAAANAGGAPLGIIPSYRKPIVDVYTETMTYVLTGTGTLAPLSRVQHSAEWKGIGLPSWVADMGAPRSTSLLTIQRFSAKEDRRPFDASRQVFKGFTVSGCTLTLHLYRYATITHVGDSLDEMWKYNTLERTAQLVLTRSELNPAQGLLIDDVWKTMLCDVLSPRHRRYSDDEMRSGFTWFLKMFSYRLGLQLRGPNRANDMSRRTKWLENLAEKDETGTIPSPEAVIASFQELDHERGSEQPEAIVFQQLLQHNMSGRRLFLLDTGEIGIGSDDVQPGDTLCIITDGARTPFVLRKASSEMSNTWILIGEAYVRGIMYGEAVDRMETSNESWEVAVVI